MKILLCSLLSFIAGGTFGIVTMCLFQINNDNHVRRIDEQS